MKKFFLSLIVLCLTLIVFAQDALIWQVEYPGKPGKLYLSGTSHMGSPDMFPLDSVYDKVFDESQVLAFEVVDIPVLLLQKYMARQFFFPKDGKNLKDRLGEQDFQLLLKYLTGLQITKLFKPEVIASMRPWFISLLIEKAEIEKLGLSEKYGWEDVFKTAAKGKKDMVSLETALLQVQVITNPAYDNEMTEDLRETVRDPEKYIKRNKDTVNSVKNCDGIALLRENREMKEKMPLTYQGLLADRNQTMTEKLFLMLDQKQVVMVLVGAGHYLGEDSITEKLTGKGCKVQRLKLTGTKGNLMPESLRKDK